VPKNDVEVTVQPLAPQPVLRREKAAGPETDSDTRRMSELSTGLLRTTIAWASTLPADIQPRALLHKFPRIANLIATMWIDPNSLRRYVDDLLMDSRSGRQGFPVDVLRELFQLRSHFDELHPHGTAPWDSTGRYS
jgi:hypothetical protein